MLAPWGELNLGDTTLDFYRYPDVLFCKLPAAYWKVNAF